MESKSFNEFYKNNSRKDGLTVYCKDCIKTHQHGYYVRNKEKIYANTVKWRSENKEYVREREREYRENNREMYRAKDKRYRDRHTEKLRIKNKKYREENPEYFRNKYRERKHRIKESSDGTVTLEYEKLLYEYQDGECDYCSVDLEETGKHLDHIVPISRGGLHTADNVHWVCPSCNLSKGNKLEEEWLS